MGPTGFDAAIEKARDKARVKREIASALEKLPKDVQRDILADLVLALDDDSPIHEKSEPDKKFVAMVNNVNGGRQTDIGHLVMTIAPGRPTGAIAPNGAGRTGAVVEMLRAHPGSTISQLAAVAYPGEKDANHKVRAILWSLKNQKRANNPEPGRWELTEKPKLEK